MTTDETKAKADLELARTEVVEREQELQRIKSRLRELGPPSTPTGEEAPNSLDIVVIKVEDVPDSAEPNFLLQLSSPIEEKQITKLFDPIDKNAEGSVAKFSGVETSVATLVVDAKDADIPLGSSEPCDVAKFAAFNAMESKTSYTQDCVVPISESELEVYEDSNADGAAPESKKSEDAVCKVTLRITFTPSKKDIRDELYSLLNAASQKKAKAIENMRKAAANVSRAVASSGGSAKGASTAGKEKSVKKGEQSRLYEVYDRYLGPKSLIRVVFPVVKNYILFFGLVGLFHYNGQYLALPPPV